MTTVFFSESADTPLELRQQLLEQAVGMKAKGYTPYVLCRPQSVLGSEALKLGLHVEHLPFRNAMHPPSMFKLANLLRQHKPVAIICHSSHDSNVSALTVHALAKMGWLNPRPTLIRMRVGQPGHMKSFTYNQLFDKAFVASYAVRDQLLRSTEVLPEKVGVLYPSIDFDGLEAASRLGLPADLDACLNDLQRRPVIAHTCEFQVDKGHSFMLQVVKALLPQFPNLLYVAAGQGGTLESVATETKRLGLQRHVLLPGALAAVAPLQRRADVLVMPSSHETLGLSQIEALALGVPVVVSNVGGLPETVQQGVTGHVCPAPHAPGALEAWVNALSTVLAHPQQARNMASVGQQTVQARFGKQSNLNNLLGTIQTPRLGRS